MIATLLSMLTDDLRRAYEATHYLVRDGEGEVAGRIGRTVPALTALLRRHGASRGVAITAWNPRSEALSRAVNEAANARMAEDLARTGLTVLQHQGRSSDGSWSEDGFFVLDLDDRAAVALAERWGQYAVTVFEADQPGRILPTRLAGQR
jgi:hypothetical protein